MQAAGIGAFVRFLRLGAGELSGDGAASWAAAAAPSLDQVIEIQRKVNPGKLPVHDLVPHCWIGLFGQSEFALRALSAVCGTFAIVLVYVIVRDLFRAGASLPPGPSVPNIDRVAALSMTVMAASLLMIRYSREARMYGLLSVLVLGQVLFFNRVRNWGGTLNYVGLGLLTAVAVATNFTSLAFLVAEGAWIACASLTNSPGADSSFCTVRWRLMAALFRGLIAFVPFASAFHASWRQRDAAGWIAHPGAWEPFETFESATGSLAFPVMALLAAWGVVRRWPVAPEAILFLVLYVWVSLVLLLLGSYLTVPMAVTRYVLASFVPFFILAAIGIEMTGSSLARSAAAVLLMIVMLMRVNSYCARAIANRRSDCGCGL